MTQTDTGFEAIIGFGAKLGDLTSEIARNRRDRALRVPVLKTLPASGLMPSSGNLALMFNQKPDQGRMWLVRGLTVGGATWGTSAAGTAEFYVSSVPGALVAANRDLSTLADEAPALPATVTYSNTQVVALGGEHLVVVIVGGTSGQLYVARVQIEDRIQGLPVFD